MNKHKKKIRKVFMIGSIGKRNIGDDTICLSLTNTLRNVLKSKITLYIYTKGQYYIRNFKKERNLQIHFVSSFTEVLKGFMNSECIIIGGGDYIGDYGHFSQRIRHYGIFLLLVILTKILLKKFLMINAGFFVATRSGSAFLKLILSVIDCVSVRDSLSFVLVSNYSCKKPLKGLDTAILLDNSCQIKTNIQRENVKNIGFSITPVFSNSFLKPEKDELLAKVIARDISIVIDSTEDVNLYFLAFNTDSKVGDLNLINKIMQMLDTKLLKRIGLIVYTNTIADFLSKFSQLDAVICCKYHSVIFSYLFKKPIIVIGYHPKNAALIRDIELPERAFLSLDDILSGKIRWVLLELLSNPEQFRAKLPIYEAKKKALNSVLKCIKCGNLI